jgi:hypothetical protein
LCGFSWRKIRPVPFFVLALALPAHAQTTPTVSRWAFTSAIRDREPVDRLEHAPDTEATISFFTEIAGAAGHAVAHIWLRDEVEVFRLAFDVRAAHWRTYSAKKVDPAGRWAVRVEDDEGFVLGTYELGEREPNGLVAPSVDRARDRSAVRKSTPSCTCSVQGAPCVVARRLRCRASSFGAAPPRQPRRHRAPALALAPARAAPAICAWGSGTAFLHSPF